MAAGRRTMRQLWEVPGSIRRGFIDNFVSRLCYQELSGIPHWSPHDPTTRSFSSLFKWIIHSGIDSIDSDVTSELMRFPVASSCCCCCWSWGWLKLAGELMNLRVLVGWLKWLGCCWVFMAVLLRRQSSSGSRSPTDYTNPPGSCRQRQHSDTTATPAAAAAAAAAHAPSFLSLEQFFFVKNEMISATVANCGDDCCGSGTSR